MISRVTSLPLPEEISFLPELWKMIHDSPWVFNFPQLPRWTPFGYLATSMDYTSKLSPVSERAKCFLFLWWSPGLAHSGLGENSFPWGNCNRDFRLSRFLTMPTAWQHTHHLNCSIDITGKDPLFLIESPEFLSLLSFTQQGIWSTLK